MGPLRRISLFPRTASDIRTRHGGWCVADSMNRAADTPYRSSFVGSALADLSTRDGPQRRTLLAGVARVFRRGGHEDRGRVSLLAAEESSCPPPPKEMGHPEPLRIEPSPGSIGSMDPEAIRIEAGPGEHESLVVALRALAAAAGVALDYDALGAALGVSFASVSTPALETPGWWMTFGRDAFLEPAARQFGIRLRDLHPPEVGMEMTGADGFDQHFALSHRPLIQRALEHGQPVLAWQGWPDDRCFLWGVITGMEGDELVGTTLWSDGRRLPLTAPAAQCYVVERCDPVLPGRADLLGTALRHGEAYVNRAPYAPSAGVPVTAPTLVTGPAAFDAWEGWLEACDDGSAPEAWNEHRQHAEFAAAARQSAGRFLREYRSAAEPDRADAIDQAIACCDAFADRLADSRDPARVESMFASRSGRQTLLEAVHAAEADDRRLGIQLERLT